MGKERTERQSNIELLRLLCMACIMLMHFIGLAVCREVWMPTAPLTPGITIGTIICSFTILSVNIFGLISGYFGIRFSWDGLIKLYFCCAFYAFLCGCFGIWMQDGTTIKDLFKQTVLAFSHSNLWYIKCYVGLFLISPILNKARDAMSKNEYMLALILLSIVNVYFGRYQHIVSYNLDGYSVSQLIWLYFIGGYIRRFCSVEWMRTQRRWIGLMLAGCIVLWNTLTLIQHSRFVPYWEPTTYNHIIPMLGAMCVFMLFLTWDLRSKVVNWLATGALSVYIVHMNPHFWNKLSATILEYEASGVKFWLPLIAVVLTISIAIFDHIRQKITNKMHFFQKKFAYLKKN